MAEGINFDVRQDLDQLLKGLQKSTEGTPLDLSDLKFEWKVGRDGARARWELRSCKGDRLMAIVTCDLLSGNATRWRGTIQEFPGCPGSQIEHVDKEHVQQEIRTRLNDAVLRVLWGSAGQEIRRLKLLLQATSRRS